jgi:hypothetical protein
MNKIIDSIKGLHWFLYKNLHLFLGASAAILTWLMSKLIIPCFSPVGDLELTIFAGVIGFGWGTIFALIILSVWDIFSNGLFSLLALWFWGGSYIAIITGGLTGCLAGIACGIFMRISIARYYL